MPTRTIATPPRRTLAFLPALLGLLAPPAFAERPSPRSCPAATPAITIGTVTLATGRAVDFDAEAGVLAAVGHVGDNAPLGGAPDTADGTGPVACMSYVAFTARHPKSGDRPILFLWDGGPGSSTRGLLLASFGPVRVPLPRPEDRTLPPAPSPIENNPDTLLDAADLVFIDAPGTGFGRIAGPNAAGQFYGIDGDAAAFAHFIERFLTLHGRTGSPVFLFGHSYGTMRSPVVARLLAGDGMPPRGIVSVAQWLNNDDNLDAAPADPGTDNAFIDALPTFAAVGWYHHRLPDRPPALMPFLADVQRFALGPYAAALLAGADATEEQRRAVAATLAADTGIPAAIWLEADLRIDGGTFRRLVLGDPRRVVGRLDARYVGLVADPLASSADGDPFGAATDATLAAASARYERDTLGFGRTAGFSPDAAVPDLRWDEYHSTDGKPWDSFFNVLPDLAAVMIEHPSTRFLLINGTYDLSTTFAGALADLRHLPIPPALRSNISVELVETGHEPYIQDDVRHAMHDRITAFLAPPR